MKKILIVQGGGRPGGNTAQLVDAFARGATDAGHQVDRISLSRVQVNGCTGCNACRYGKPCVQKDGFSELIPQIREADLIAFASPLYFWTFEQAVSYYRFAVVRYIGFHDRGVLLAGGCGDTNGRPQIAQTGHLQRAYAFGQSVYEPERS